ncbi:MAG: PspC domain-containing protein [Flavobacteriales bacterium]
MKKTLTANISGTVFHIEEDAYDRLHRYLNTIRGQFTGSDGREEIMADIESRIAELFTERLDGRRQVVSIDDVEHVIGIMGQPEDYVMGEGQRQQEQTSGQAGSAYSGPTAGKRFFRHPEDKWVGGVLGGLGAYLNIDPLILRLVYLIFLFLGFGVVLYLILWIVVPKADSAADMLRMRGEPVNVENIKRMFNEGSERFQQGARNMATEAEELGRRWSQSGQQWGQGAGRDLESGLKRLLTVVGKILGFAFLMGGAVLILSILGVLVGGGTFTYDNLTGLGQAGLFELGSVAFDSSAQALWFISSLVLLGLVPAIGMLIGGVRLVTDARPPQWISWTLTIIWVVALFAAIVIGTRVGNDFSEEQSMVHEVDLVQPAGQTLYLDLHDMRGTSDGWEVKYKHGRVDWDMEGLRVTDDSIHGAWARLDVVPSTDSLFHLIVEREANGRTEKMALARASHTSFTYLQTDSLVRFSPWVDMPRADKLRAQMVTFVVQVPVGRAVHFNGGTGLLLHDVDNVSNTLDEDMVGRTWTMTRYGLNDQVRPEDVRDEVVPVEKRGQRNDDAASPADAPAAPEAGSVVPSAEREVRVTSTLPDLRILLSPLS